MKETPNPYEPVAAPSADEPTSARKLSSLSRLMSTLIGVLVGTLSTVVIAEILALIALLPPLYRWLDLASEFAGLILIAMPIFGSGCGAWTGLVLGLMYRKFGCRLVSMVLGSLPIVMYCVGGHVTGGWKLMHPSIYGILILATVFAVVVTHFVLVSIDRRRSSLTPTTNMQGVVRTGRVVVLIAMVLALGSLSYDVWFWRVLESSEDFVSEIRPIEAFVLGMLATASNVCIGVAYPKRKRVAFLVGIASFAGCVAVLVDWYLHLIQ